MLTQAVVLYMTYTYNLPTWCKVLVWMAIAINVFRFIYGIYKAGENAGL